MVISLNQANAVMQLSQLGALRQELGINQENLQGRLTLTPQQVCRAMRGAQMIEGKSWGLKGKKQH